MAHAARHYRALAPDHKINDVGLGFVLKCFARGSYAVEQEFELDKNIDYRCHRRKCTHVNVHSRLSSVMLVCKNAIITFWNALWSNNNNKLTS